MKKGVELEFKNLVDMDMETAVRPRKTRTPSNVGKASAIRKDVTKLNATNDKDKFASPSIGSLSRSRTICSWSTGSCVTISILTPCRTVGWRKCRKHGPSYVGWGFQSP